MLDNFDNIDDKRGEVTLPSIPFEQAWAALQPELDKEAVKRKRKRRFLFFLLSFIAIVLVGGLVGLKDSKSLTHSFAKSNGGRISQPAVSVIALPMVVGKSLVKKNNNSISSYQNPIRALSPYRVSHHAISGKEAVVEATNSFNPKSKKNIPTKDAIKVVNEQINANSENQTLASVSKEKEKDLVKSTPIASDTLTTKKADTTQNTTAAKTVKKQKHQKKSLFSYGLQFSVPVQAGVNSLDVNGNKEPLALLIPQVWGSVQIAKKQDLLLLINPYSQYYLNDKIDLSYSKYSATVQRGSNINNAPEKNYYTQVLAVNKLIALQASLVYQYQVSNKIKMGAGISTNFLQGALLENKITKNNSLVTHDSLYGIDRRANEWSLLKNNFFTGRLEGTYQLKNIEIGAALNKTIGGVTNHKLNTTPPLNANVFLRWKIR